jgi:hypothetical protein
MREEESAGEIIKLTFIITLDALDGASKLRGHKGEEMGEGGEGVRLLVQWKCPRVVGAVIEDDQVILVTRDSEQERYKGYSVRGQRVKQLERKS